MKAVLKEKEEQKLNADEEGWALSAYAAKRHDHTIDMSHVDQDVEERPKRRKTRKSWRTSKAMMSKIWLYSLNLPPVRVYDSPLAVEKKTHTILPS